MPSNPNPPETPESQEGKKVPKRLPQDVTPEEVNSVRNMASLETGAETGTAAVLSEEAAHRLNSIDTEIHDLPANLEWSSHGFEGSEKGSRILTEEIRASETYYDELYFERDWSPTSGLHTTKGRKVDSLSWAYNYQARDRAEAVLEHIIDAVTTNEEEAVLLYEWLPTALEEYGNADVHIGFHKLFNDYMQAHREKDQEKISAIEAQLQTQLPDTYGEKICALLKNDSYVGEQWYRIDAAVWHEERHAASNAELYYATRDQESFIAYIQSKNVYGDNGQSIIREIEQLPEDEQRTAREREIVAAENISVVQSWQDDVDAYTTAKITELRKEHPNMSYAELELLASREVQKNYASERFEEVLRYLGHDLPFTPEETEGDNHEKTVEQLHGRLRTFFAQYGPDSERGFMNFMTQYRTAFEQNDQEAVAALRRDMESAFPRFHSYFLMLIRTDSSLEEDYLIMSTSLQLASAADFDLENLRNGEPTQAYKDALGVLLSDGGSARQRLEDVQEILAQTGDEDIQILQEQALQIGLSSSNPLLRGISQQKAIELRRRQEGPVSSQVLESSLQRFGLQALDRLPSVAQEALGSFLADHQAREIVGLMLNSDVSWDDNQITGSIAGADVAFNYVDSTFWILGQDSNHRFEPTPMDYDQTRVHAMAVDGSSYEIASNESLAESLGLFLVGEDLNDGETMTQFDANKIENFMQLLCGKNVDARDERDRLRQVGIYRSSGEISPLQIQRFAYALPHYYGDAGERNIEEDGPLGFEAMVTLSQIWKEEGFRLPERNELIARSKEHLA